MKSLFAAIFLLIITLGGCQRPYHYKPASEARPPASGNILFLTLKMTTDSAGNHAVNLLQKKIVAGTYKATPEIKYVAGYLLVTQWDNHQELQRQEVEHPLIKQVEFINDQNQFERKLVALKEADFFIRLQLQPAAKFIRIEEITEGKKDLLKVIAIP
ncbi:MAG: hypothetical protein ACOYXT_14225 [Bacteroidota bacterium]